MEKPNPINNLQPQGGAVSRLQFFLKKFLIRSSALEEEAKEVGKQMDELQRKRLLEKTYKKIVDIKDTP